LTFICSDLNLVGMNLTPIKMTQPANVYDQNFSTLMQNQKLARHFYETCLPADVKTHIDWSTLQFERVDTKNYNVRSQRNTIADVVHAVKVKGEAAVLWTHCEHQSTSDKWMLLRVLEYQLGLLRNKVQQDNPQKLPVIISFIYHQGKGHLY
jgi:predicted transposase YdaD